MVLARQTSKVNVFVGNEDYLQPLAALNSGNTPDDRWVRSLSIGNTNAIDKIPTLGSEGIESIVNQYSVEISAAIIYGSGPKALRARQDLATNVMAIVFLDTMTHYVIPVTWTGQPIENPTNSLITTSMTFLQNLSLIHI